MRRIVAESALARENLMLDCLCTAVKHFYENPNNRKAYEAWKSKQEVFKNEHNHDNHGGDEGEH